MNTKKLENTSFIVLRDHHLTDEEQQILTHLYMPLVGPKSINMYMTLGTFIKKGETESILVSHLKLFQLLQTVSENEVVKERQKLEAVGLLQVLTDGNNYIYKLNHALMPNDFFNNETLSTFLLQQLGKEEYERLMLELLVHRFDISKFTDITTSFDEVFDITNNQNYTYNDELNCLLVKPNGEQIRVKNPHFDYQLLRILVEALDIINKDIIDSKEFYDIVNRYSFLYQLTTEEIKDAVIESTGINKNIDYETFKKACKRIYDKHDNKTKIVVKNTTPSSDKLINVLEQTAPTEVVKNLFGIGLVSSEIEMFDTLMERTGISLGILNVLIIYVLQDKNGEVPSYNYFDKIIKTWQRMKITTTSEAMDYINGRTPKETTRKRQSTKAVPDWYDDYVKNVEDKENKPEKPKANDQKTIEELDELFKFKTR